MKTAPRNPDRWKLASLALIPVFLLLIGVLAVLNIPGSLEYPFALAFLNTLFLGIIPVVIAYLSFRVVSRSGSASVFLLGSGVLVFGLGSIVAGWVNPLPGGPNMTVTIHNTCAFIGSILIFAGAVIRRPGSKTGAGSVSAGMVAAAYAGIFIFVAALSFAALQGLTPPFFTLGSGPTVLRQVVLENAVLLFAISSGMFMAVWRREHSDFFFWYAGGLALIAIGLLAVFVQPSVGSLIGWVGRLAQYLGFVYALNAILIARKTAAEKGLPLEKVIADFFSDAEQSYTTLVETATDAIVVFDSDDRVIVWNKAAETVFGYRKEEAMGSSFMDLAIPEESAGIIKNNFSTPAIPGADPASQRSVEIVARRKDGSSFPAEMALSSHMVAGTWVRTCIVHDLTGLKKTETELKQKNEDLLALNEELTSTQEELQQSNDELIRSERELGVKNAQLQAVFDYSAASLVLFDAKKPYTVLAHNTFYQKLWAEPFRSQGLVGKNLYDYVPEVEVSGVMEVYDEVVRTRQAKTLLNFPYDGMDRGRTYWNWHLSPVIKDGEVVALAHMAVDVTNEVVARLKTEEMASAIRESEARFRSVLDNSRDFIYRTNLQTGRYEYVSPSVKEVLGYEPDEFASMGTQTSMATVHPDDLAFVMKAMERLEDTGTAEVEYRLRNKQGEYRWVSNNLSVIKDSSGRPLYRSGSVRDITERKKVEETLRLSERNLATSQEIAAVGSYTWDLKTNRMLWSDELYRILGLVPGEVPPAFDTYTAFIFPDDREETIRKSRRMNETGETRPNEHRIVRADGTVRTVQVISRVFSTMDGRPSVLHGVVQDITERKQAEEEVRQKNINLNALNEELTATEEELKQNIEDLGRNQEVLRQNEERLKSALAEKEVLLSEIHHRVKNNLTAFISLLALEGSTEETSAGRELRKDLQNRARSMALIHETLYRTHQFSEVDMETYLTPLIDQIVNSYSSPQSIRTFVEAKGVALDLARATPVGLIVNELVTNSLKHAFPHGGKECRMGQNDPCTIGVRLTKEDGSYLLSVYDNGVGLPAGFDPLTAKTLGLKLVTFLAKHQVRAKIEVKTEKGTEFVLRFKE